MEIQIQERKNNDPTNHFHHGCRQRHWSATALQFHARGWFVGAADVDQAGLDVLKRDLDNDCFTAFLDVTDKAAFDQVMIDFGTAAGQRLDILFNNAGIAVFGFLDEVPFEKTLATVNVNLIGVLNGIHASIHLLKQTPNALCFTTSSSAANVRLSRHGNL